MPLVLLRTAALHDAVGALLGPTRWRYLSQSDVDLFARATGGALLRHDSPSPDAGGTSATVSGDGYLPLSVAGTFVPQLIQVDDCSAVINYGCEDVRFSSAVTAPMALRARGTIASASAISGGVQVRIELTIDVQGDCRPACVVTSILRYLD